jgi:hypothetical protein
MKKFVIGVMALVAVFMFSACGGSNGSSKEDIGVENFDLIGAIDCRNVNDFGGEVKLRARVSYDEAIQVDSFTYEYSLNGNVVDFETPIVTTSRDGSVYELNGDMYIYPNNTDTDVVHVFDLTYLDGEVTRLYRGGCSQGVYVRILPAQDVNGTI